MSGSLDLDKMEYLRRDARFCGVPYGEVDVDRLIQGLVLLPDPESGLYEVGVHEKAVASLESLLFAKYQMFRNVYWHHGVRAATALYKRIVEEAVAEGLVTPADLVGPTDEELLYEIGRRAERGGHARSGAAREPVASGPPEPADPQAGPGTHGRRPGRDPPSRPGSEPTRPGGGSWRIGWPRTWTWSPERLSWTIR